MVADRNSLVPPTAIACPQCGPPSMLEEHASPLKEHVCRRCRGTLLNVAAARWLIFEHLQIHPESFKGLVLTAVHRGVACPGCHRRLVIVSLGEASVSACVHCGMLWLADGALHVLTAGLFGFALRESATEQASPVPAVRRAVAPVALAPDSPPAPLPTVAAATTALQHAPTLALDGRSAALSKRSPPAPRRVPRGGRFVLVGGACVFALAIGWFAMSKKGPKCTRGEEVSRIRTELGKTRILCALGGDKYVELIHGADRTPEVEAELTGDVRDGLARLWERPAGIRREGNFKAGKRAGTWTTFDVAGKRIEESQYEANQRNGKLTAWYPDGIIKATEEYKNDKLEGRSERFDVRGALTAVEEYRAGNLIQSMGPMDLKRITDIPGARTLSDVREEERTRGREETWHVFGGRPAQWWEARLRELEQRNDEGAKKMRDVMRRRIELAGLVVEQSADGGSRVSPKDAVKTIIRARRVQP